MQTVTHPRRLTRPSTRPRGPGRIGPLLILLLVASTLLHTAPPALYAATRTVTTAAGSGPGSLRQVIADAAPGDTITFGPGLAGATIALSSPLAIGADLTIDGSALSAPITLSGADAVQVLTVAAGAGVTLDGLTIADGYTPGDGGAIHSAGSLTLVSCTLAGNRAGDHGGAIANRGSLTLTASTLSDNGAGIHGGAIYNLGALTVADSTLSGNTASMDGGAIENGGSATVRGSTFRDNTASQHGGAIDTYDRLLVVNSTFYANRADDEGGAIYNWHALTVEHATLVGNRAGHYGGGLHNRPGATLHLANSIIAHSALGGDCFGADEADIATNAANLIADGSCAPALDGDPLLGPLGEHGGPVATFPLLPGSPAINAGDSAHCASSDQRGALRPQGEACDIGAYEVRLAGAATGGAEDVTASGATLLGTVTAHEGDATAAFQYGETPEYGGKGAAEPATVPDGESADVRLVLGGLLPNTTYRYRVSAANHAGVAHGRDATFTSLRVPPAAVTGPATDVSTTGAALHATVNAHNDETIVGFHFGPEDTDGETIAAEPSTVSGMEDTAVRAVLTGLAPGTTYRYRVVAANGAGEVQGEDGTFTTAPPRITHLPLLYR